jgi:hypothetical protein
MKRGNLIKTKLIWYFNSANACFVQTRSGLWAQVTPNEFRSFDGPRKLKGITIGPKRESIHFEKDYEGPIYGLGTNFLMEGSDSRQVLQHLSNHRIEARQRDCENF